VDGVTLGQVAARFGLVLRGDPDARVSGVATLKDARPGSVSFLTNPRYGKYLAGTLATAVVLDEATSAGCRTAALVTDNPYAAYARIAAWLHPEPAAAPGIHPSAVVDPSARIAASAAVGPHAVVEARAEIGERAVVGAGTVVGADSVVGEDELQGIGFVEAVLNAVERAPPLENR
jgi:UDP-3-O-[3-hydroxymyristoyl] glucosamine N-acyltransferase